MKLVTYLLIVYFLPFIVYAQFTNGIKYLSENKTDEAIIEFEKKQPDDENNRIYLGYSYYLKGENQKAKDVLEGSEELISQLLLAEIFYQEGKLSDAKEYYERIELQNSDIQLVHIRLYELLKAENPELAQTHYVRVFQLPKTELKDYLPLVENIDYKLPTKENIYISSYKLESTEKSNIPFNFITTTNIATSGDSEIIITMRKGKNIIKSFGNIFNEISLEFIIEKLTELLIVGIFLLILYIVRQREEQRIKNIVLNNYRISKPGSIK